MELDASLLEACDGEIVELEVVEKMEAHGDDGHGVDGQELVGHTRRQHVGDAVAAERCHAPLVEPRKTGRIQARKSLSSRTGTSHFAGTPAATVVSK